MSKTDTTLAESKVKRAKEHRTPIVFEDNGKWSPEDETRLLNLVDMKDEISWLKVAKEFPGKSAASCQSAYEDLIKRDGKKGNWTFIEDELLRQWVKFIFIIG